MLRLALSFRHDVASSHALGSRSEFEPIPSVSFELQLSAPASPAGGAGALVGRLLIVLSLEFARALPRPLGTLLSFRWPLFH